MKEFDHGDKTVFLVKEGEPEVMVQMTKLWFETGIVSEGCRCLTDEEWKAELEARRAKDCFCQLLDCVCDQVRTHKPKCRFRVSTICAIPIACEHGFDVCPTCDVCDCSTVDGGTWP